MKKQITRIDPIQTATVAALVYAVMTLPFIVLVFLFTIWRTGVDGQDANFNAATLRWADLGRAQLTGANFKLANADGRLVIVVAGAPPLISTRTTSGSPAVGNCGRRSIPRICQQAPGVRGDRSARRDPGLRLLPAR